MATHPKDLDLAKIADKLRKAADEFQIAIANKQVYRLGDSDTLSGQLVHARAISWHVQQIQTDL